ncbi:MAG: hypothetical protein DA330_04840 [Nitrososphaera sp.]|nr:hypothetical protein [Nitrososphaera sp.]
MRSKLLSLFGLFFAFAAILLSLPNAFAGGAGGTSNITKECNDPVCHVTMTDLTFTPDTLKVKSDTTVVWTNMDTIGHTVTSGSPTDQTKIGLLFGSAPPVIASNANWEHKFDTTAQTFDYFCQVHPGMVGKIVVSGEVLPVFPQLILVLVATGAVASLIAVILVRRNRRA